MAWEKSVFSSNVASIGWDEAGMIVTWNSGRRSLYEGVTEDDAMSIARAPSVGQALNMDIKPYYPHRYV